MTPARGNLLGDLPDASTGERVQTLLTRPGIRIERIISAGQASPPEFWYDQPQDEWVAVLQGAATLRIEGESEPIEMTVGDWIELPAHCRHRVESTAATPPTVWLAVHWEEGP